MEKLDNKVLQSFVEERFESSIIPELKEYIKIPNQSPSFDANWASNGLMDKVVDLMVKWVKERSIPGLTHKVVRLPNRTPVIYMEVPPTEAGAPTCLLYGHMDKQPPCTGWNEGLEPYNPVLKDGKLYGRGGADDGYAIYSALTAIEALKKQGVAHGRCVILIEACEESGSPDLPFYIRHLQAEIGTPSLVICLDSGAGNYEQLWVTTSLRGVFFGNLSVRTLREGVHSGDASGIVPDTFRIARHLLSRIEDPETGAVCDALKVDIPAKHRQWYEEAVKIKGNATYTCFPFLEGVHPVKEPNLVELALNRSWRPTVTVVGADGLPPTQTAGSVLRENTTLKLSIRLPPSLDPVKGAEDIKRILEANPPYGAHVEFTSQPGAAGWVMPEIAPSTEAAEKALQYGRDAEGKKL
eukprot:NODE_1780_length_1384_cov_234.933970_g1038_i1.p1 GENE.NODE_1780_length_1384_cov_234.933970_g1038_i1~~NODE_1780_length_1384_cov_234.933970_g1038_i1.p1  ORF type:complete len:411 (+),score=80.93 NODE_1780_length_1384_cov_234.933970_g1038_i1:57-1289(+)